ncbi:hypothetical protein [Leucobacter insecticola]|uniref:hypothetical protein n=1 Tax=Leucobacter insecticola TaxID=2714934 RepID=UPI001FCAA3D9|nr:hypothetical protein [Leucobacter insecticola]
MAQHILNSIDQSIRRAQDLWLSPVDSRGNLSDLRARAGRRYMKLCRCLTNPEPQPLCLSNAAQHHVMPCGEEEFRISAGERKPSTLRTKNFTSAQGTFKVRPFYVRLIQLCGSQNPIVLAKQLL